MSHYKVIVVDVDGTLVTTHKEVSELTRNVIKKIKAHDMKFVIASGRPVISVEQLIHHQQLEGLVDYIICSNGVEMKNCHTSTIKKAHPLSKDDLVNIVHMMAPYNLDYCCYVDEKMYTNNLNELSLDITYRNGLVPVIAKIDDVPVAHANKILFTVFEKDQPLLRAFQAQFKSDRYASFFTDPELLEFVDKRVSKAKGIELIIEDLNISMSDVMTFGDAQNDIEMIIAAGHGVAMSNANDDIKAIADGITTQTNDEDGVAHYLMDVLGWD